MKTLLKFITLGIFLSLLSACNNSEEDGDADSNSDSNSGSNMAIVAADTPLITTLKMFKAVLTLKENGSPIKQSGQITLNGMPENMYPVEGRQTTETLNFPSKVTIIPKAGNQDAGKWLSIRHKGL